MERPKASAGQVLIEGVGYVDGDDKIALKKATFQQKMLMINLMIVVPLFLIFCLIYISITR